LDDVDQIGFSFNPINRLARNIGIEEDVENGDWGSPEGERLYYKLSLSVPSILEEKYKVKVAHKFNYLPHHICHASSAYYDSPFTDSAVITFDGIGEFCSITLGVGKNNILAVLEETGEYPNSVGFLWTKASRFLGILLDGFGEYGAGKVMALASFGKPKKYYKKFKKFIKYDKLGNYQANGDVMQFRLNSHEGYEKMFGFKARQENEEFTQDHLDFSAALQQITNEIVLGYVNRLYEKTKQKNLCMAGGVALNCTTNAYILKNSKFENIYIQPGANDMGTAVGAAYYVYHQILGNERNVAFQNNPYSGPEYSDEEIEASLENRDVQFTKINDIEKITAQLIANGKVIGWFQGRTEFGPRALGNRSIIGDPRNRDMFEKISIGIKKREWFRPLAPIAMEEYVDEWFERTNKRAESDKWMLFAYNIYPKKRDFIPAVTHKDGTGRVQVVNKESNSRLHNLTEEFYNITGVPILINTSFNIGEPMVLTPENAIDTFLKSGENGIDVLVLGNYIITRKDKNYLDFLK